MVDSLVFLFGLFVVQIFIWRVFRPRREALTLFILYLGVPILAWLFFLDTKILVGILAHSICYVLMFPAVSAVSPSFEILLLLRVNPGLTSLEICERLASRKLVGDRLSDLERDGLLHRQQDGEMTFTRFGLAVTGFFVFYRRLLGLSQGSG